MITFIIVSVIAYAIYKTLRHLTDVNPNTNGISGMNEEEGFDINTTKARLREIADRYHASHIAYGNTFIGEDGCTYLQCSLDVDDSDALDIALDLDDEFGDSIDNMDITFNNSNMDNNQQQTPQIIFVNENNGTINGDYHNHHDDRKSRPSDNAPYAEFEEVTDDDPLPAKGETKDETAVKTKPAVKDICAKLKTKNAVTLWKKLQDKGWVDEDYHPVGLLGWQEVLLADAIAKHVGIRNKWQVFEHFWDMTFMKQTFQKAVSNQEAPAFYDRLSELGL